MRLPQERGSFALSTFKDIIHLSSYGDMIGLSLYVDKSVMSSFVDKGDSVRVSSALDLAAAIKGRRKDLGMTQVALAKQADVARSWLVAVEGGKISVEFGLILKVLDALNLEIDVSPMSDTPRQTLSDVFKGPRVDLDKLIDQRGRR